MTSEELFIEVCIPLSQLDHIVTVSIGIQGNWTSLYWFFKKSFISDGEYLYHAADFAHNSYSYFPDLRTGWDIFFFLQCFFF